MEKHFTATTYVVKDSKILLIFHPKHHKWLPPGGHLEKGETPSQCAVREAFEETGLEVELVAEEHLQINCWNAVSLPRPYMCLLENIPEWGENAAHQHIDLIYLAKPIGGQLIQGEHLKWFSLEEVEALHTDEEIFGETKMTIRHLLTHG